MHRRTFLASSGALVVMGSVSGRASGRASNSAHGEPVARAGKALRLLVLGGTGFLGPHIVEHARARGHTLTLFNRGRTNPDLFPGIEKLRGNRDPELLADRDDATSPRGLRELEGREFDGVIDTSSYVPRITRASAELLRDRIGHYHMVSTISAYAGNARANADETDPLARMDDPTLESRDMQFYGPLKAECERALEAVLGQRQSVTRPGLIAGPGDQTDRFTYWPWRIDRGGEVLAPGDGHDPAQFIDVRDLARFIVGLVEKGVGEGLSGAFNAVGPGEPTTMREVLERVARGIGRESELTWVDSTFLESRGVGAWQDMPMWIPRTLDGYAGFATRSNARAIDAGLTFSSIEDSARDTLAWLREQGADRQARLRAGITPDREASVLRAWKDR